MDFQKAVKQLRKELLLTQTEFAKRLGVSFVSVNRWENGRCEPTMRTKRAIKELCRKYKIKIVEEKIDETK
jgi:putative transcriptional regulator